MCQRRLDEVVSVCNYISLKRGPTSRLQRSLNMTLPPNGSSGYFACAQSWLTIAVRCPVNLNDENEAPGIRTRKRSTKKKSLSLPDMQFTVELNGQVHRIKQNEFIVTVAPNNHTRVSNENDASAIDIEVIEINPFGV